MVRGHWRSQARSVSGRNGARWCHGGEVRLPYRLVVLRVHLHETLTNGPQSGLSARAEVELPEDFGNVCAGRSLTDRERSGDLLVRLSGRDETKHVELSRSEVGGGVISGALAKRRHQASCNLRIELQLASMRRAHGDSHVVGIRVLQQVSRCPCLEGGVYALIVAE